MDRNDRNVTGQCKYISILLPNATCKVSIALSAAFMGWTLFVVLALGCPFAKMHIGMNPIEVNRIMHDHVV